MAILDLSVLSTSLDCPSMSSESLVNEDRTSRSIYRTRIWDYLGGKSMVILYIHLPPTAGL